MSCTSRGDDTSADRVRPNLAPQASNATCDRPSKTGSGRSTVRFACSRAVAEGAGRRSAICERNRRTGHPPAAISRRWPTGSLLASHLSCDWRGDVLRWRMLQSLTSRAPNGGGLGAKHATAPRPSSASDPISSICATCARSARVRRLLAACRQPSHDGRTTAPRRVNMATDRFDLC